MSANSVALRSAFCRRVSIVTIPSQRALEASLTGLIGRSGSTGVSDSFFFDATSLIPPFVTLWRQNAQCLEALWELASKLMPYLSFTDLSSARVMRLRRVVNSWAAARGEEESSTEQRSVVFFVRAFIGLSNDVPEFMGEIHALASTVFFGVLNDHHGMSIACPCRDAAKRSVCLNDQHLEALVFKECGQIRQWASPQTPGSTKLGGMCCRISRDGCWISR